MHIVEVITLKGKKMKKIYVASSWRNKLQPGVVTILRTAGFTVYDFKDEEGFHWSDIDPFWEQWKNNEYLDALESELATKGFMRDLDAMEKADTFVLVQPCGRSAHLELGWAIGKGKECYILLSEEIEPELMIRLVGMDNIATSIMDLLKMLGVED